MKSTGVGQLTWQKMGLPVTAKPFIEMVAKKKKANAVQLEACKISKTQLIMKNIVYAK